jgi:hypothetical protein
MEVNINVKKTERGGSGLLGCIGSLYWRLAPPLFTGLGSKVRCLSHFESSKF